MRDCKSGKVFTVVLCQRLRPLRGWFSWGNERGRTLMEAAVADMQAFQRGCSVQTVRGSNAATHTLQQEFVGKFMRQHVIISL